MTVVYIVIVVLALLVIYTVAIYNRLVSVHNLMKNTWAYIEVLLKRRYDLIPNLVGMVKSYMQHEKGTLEAITSARTAAMTVSGADPAVRAKVEGELTAAVSRLLVVVENYPDLKARQNFLSLQKQLAATENNISMSRHRYNEMVMMCNNLNQQFPTNILANMFGFKDGEFFEVTENGERTAPQVTVK